MKCRTHRSTAVIYVVSGDDVFNAAEVLRGVGSVARTTGATVISTRSPPDARVARASHPNAGIIMTPGRSEWTPALPGWERRAVGLYSYRWTEGIAKVTPDDYAVGVAAAEHLLSRGYRRLAFYGTDARWSQLRCDGFHAAAGSGGVQAECLLVPTWDDLPKPAYLNRLLSYLAGPPVGVLACNDGVAVGLRDEFTRVGRDIPDDVGIVGVDNHELRCAYGWIPLSSVDVNSRRMGIEAARLLLDLLAGRADASEHRRVQPKGVIPRLSTDALLITDRVVSSALRLIRGSVSAGLSVEDVTRHVGLSRPTLDRRFKEVLGHTVSDELLRVRLAAARRQLESSRDQLTKVAQAAGFKHLSNFSAAFRRLYGKSPSRWRAELGPATSATSPGSADD